jgi:excisionase family DNA binding protein
MSRKKKRLAARPRPPEPSVQEVDRLLITKPELAARTGLSERKLDDLVQRGELPAVRIGRSIRFAVTDVIAFIEGKRHLGPAPAKGASA